MGVNYSEGLSTSYRNPDFSFDFPFGFRLTYTTLQLKNVYAFFWGASTCRSVWTSPSTTMARSRAGMLCSSTWNFRRRHIL